MAALGQMHKQEFELRPFQLETLNALAQPHHVLCVAPTGSGKSLIYEQMACRPGIRMLLVTPLIALARQQEARLKSIGVRVLRVTGGDSKHSPLLIGAGAWIVSPETLDRFSWQCALSRWKPNFMVVDECHCLWDWGESFRPAFRTLPQIVSQYQIARSLWLTATLPPDARTEMKEWMPKPWVELGSFGLPPRLFLEVVRVPWSVRSEYLLNRISGQSGSGIVFVSTREGAIRVARLIAATGKSVVAYHAGLSQEERRAAEKLIGSETVEIVVATSAFGMGMDYGHLKWVILWQPPVSLLSLAQMIGRVGRSQNADSVAVVFWDDEDFRLSEWMTERSCRIQYDLEELARFLRKESCYRTQLEFYFNQNTFKKSSFEKCQQCSFCQTLPS